MAESTIACRYFDGHSSRPHAVTLGVEAGHAVVAGEGVARREPLARVGVSEKMGNAPRLVSFADGAYCEVHDHAGLDLLLHATGFREPLVARLQRQWSMALIAIGISAALGVWVYLQGLPWAAEHAARQLPASILDSASSRTLSFLDSHFMQPSEIPSERQAQLADRFRRLVPPGGPKVRHDLLFRRSDGLGANAFALPSGTIVVTDQLVGLARSDEDILAVLCHELGHVDRRHGMRQVLQASFTGLFFTWLIGDVSSVLATVPSVLLQARYSRDHEREADDYAVSMLRANGLAPGLLATMLERLEAAHARSEASRQPSARESTGYLDSHPATAERIRAIRAQ